MEGQEEPRGTYCPVEDRGRAEAEGEEDGKGCAVGLPRKILCLD